MILRLEDALDHFHRNKAVFLDLGARGHFNIPKLHSLIHYTMSITLFGATDNYNTEQTERLHIDLAKDAYRATNRKDEYWQMTTWLERRERVQQHTAYLAWREQAGQDRTTSKRIAPPIPTPRNVKMARNPTAKAVSFDDLARRYGAVYFQDELADFVAHINHPSASAAVRRSRAADTLIPFRSVPVFHKIKFTSKLTSDIIDAVHVRPEQSDAHGRVIPAWFDTVLIRESSSGRACANGGEFQLY